MDVPSRAPGIVSTAIFLLARLAADRRTGVDSAATLGVRLRAAFEHLGGIWIKVGQILSYRLDVLPPDTCRELAALQDNAHPFASEIAVGLVERSVGASMEEVFSEFDDTPLAAATIGQVHRGRLRGGGLEVAVKVMRPGRPPISFKCLVPRAVSVASPLDRRCHPHRPRWARLALRGGG